MERLGHDVENTRYQSEPALRATDVPKLALKWAFGYPGTSVSGQPTIVDGRVFVASAAGRVYALDAKTGCTYWTYDAQAGVRTAISHRGTRRRQSRAAEEGQTRQDQCAPRCPKAAECGVLRRRQGRRLRARRRTRHALVEDAGRYPADGAHSGLAHALQRPALRGRRLERVRVRRRSALCVLHVPRQRGRARYRDRPHRVENLHRCRRAAALAAERRRDAAIRTRGRADRRGADHRFGSRRRLCRDRRRP